MPLDPSAPRCIEVAHHLASSPVPMTTAEVATALGMTTNRAAARSLGHWRARGVVLTGQPLVLFGAKRTTWIVNPNFMPVLVASPWP